MIKKIKNIWWIPLTIGIAALSFGIIALLKKDLVLSVIIFIIGLGFLFNGVNEFITSYNIRKERGWWSYSIYGVLSIVIGLLFVINPRLSASAIVMYLGIWCATRGLSQIILGLKLPLFKATTITTGIIILISSLIMFLYPEEVSNAIINILGLTSIIFGIFQIFSSTKIKRAMNEVVTYIEN